MSKLTIPQIREAVKAKTAALRVCDDIDRPLLCDDIDALIEQARRAPNKGKPVTQEMVDAPIGKPKSKTLKVTSVVEEDDAQAE